MIFLHLDAGHDVNGNPRRLYVVLDQQANVVEVIDEGYEGRGALRKYAPKTTRGLPIVEFETTPRQYRELLKQQRETVRMMSGRRR